MSAFQIVRLKKGKGHFEVMVKPGTVMQYRKGELGYDNVVVLEEIFKNQTKAEKASASDLVAGFETDNLRQCIEIVLQKGDVQLTAAERKAKVDNKRRKIVHYIHKYYVNPQSKLPHPVARIENALEEMRYRVDGDTPTERQIQDVLKRLSEFIPITKMEIIGRLSVPHKHMGQVPSVLRKYNINASSERWGDEGCVMEISLVPGDYDAFLGDMNNTFSGEYQFEVEGGAGTSLSSSSSSSSSEGGKGGKRGGRGGKRK